MHDSRYARGWSAVNVAWTHLEEALSRDLAEKRSVFLVNGPKADTKSDHETNFVPPAANQSKSELTLAVAVQGVLQRVLPGWAALQYLTVVLLRQRTLLERMSRSQLCHKALQPVLKSRPSVVSRKNSSGRANRSLFSHITNSLKFGHC